MTYTPRIPLRPHQLEALRRASARPSRPSSADVFAYLLDMGLGKSAITLAEFGQYEAEGQAQDLLIVAPAGSYLNWCEDKSAEQPSEFKKHLAPNLFLRLAFAAWQSNKKSKAYLDGLNALMRAGKRPRAFIVNIEALSSVKAARELCKQFLSTPGRRSMMVVDESTGIKGNSIRAEEIQELGQLADCRRILTGLIAPKSPLDLYRQMAFLDWRILGHRSFYSFRARYAVMRKMTMGGRTFQVVVGYKNVEELQTLMAPYSYRVLKEDALDLPPKKYDIKEISLTPEQRRMYQELKEYATSQIEGENHVTATSVLTQIVRLHQLVVGHVVNEQGGIHAVQSNRLDELVKILRQHEGKVIIWANYRYSITQILDRLVHEFGYDSVAAFHGGNKSTRAEDERRFLADPACRFMVSTPAAGGKGNTWVVANLVIYFDNGYDLELRMQSEDRCHRDGLKHQVNYIDLVARGTVDEKIIKALRNKINLATAISGENWREWVI